MRPKTTIATAAAGLVVLAGCGQDDATDAAQNAKTQARTVQQQAQDALSPQARAVLTDAQTLAGDVATTARRFAAQDVTTEQAQESLGRYEDRAGDLARRARDLPATDAARDDLLSLTDQVRGSAAAARDVVSDGVDPSKAVDVLADLRSEADDLYDRYRTQLPADARKKVGEALDALGA